MKIYALAREITSAPLKEGTAIASPNSGSFRWTAAVLLLTAVLPLRADLIEPVVDSISISGDIPISQNKLLDGTGLDIGASLLRITPVQVRDGVETNLRELGYLKPSVTVQWPLWNDEENVVRIGVDTGERSLLSGLVFSGATVFPADTLASFYPASPGDPITPTDTSTFRNSVLKLYSERGYIYTDLDINVQGLEEEGNGSSSYHTVECAITQGAQARLSGISVSGLATVRKKVVTREILLQPGDSLNLELLRQSITNIYSLGLFQDVRFSYQPHDNDSTLVDLDIALTESDYRRVDLGSGYLSPSAVFGNVTWLHPNIMGNNQQLTIGAYYLEYIGSRDGRRIEPEVIYEEPWFLSTHWQWQLKFGYLYLFTPGTRQRSYSITSTFARDLTRHLRFSAGYSLEYEKYNEWDGEAFTTNDWRTTSSIASTIIHDTRHPVLDPVRGHWMRGRGKISGGILGGSDYYSLSSEARLFFPLSSEFILAGRLRTSGAFPYGDDTTVPPDERFFLGGGTTVRGYPFNSLGPEDDEGNPIGGRVELLGNFEVRASIIGDLGVVLFADAGGLWNSLDQIDLNSTGFGTGIGLRYATVFGPIRLDYGFAPTWRNSIRRGRFYIGLGHAF